MDSRRFGDRRFRLFRLRLGPGGQVFCGQSAGVCDRAPLEPDIEAKVELMNFQRNKTQRSFAARRRFFRTAAGNSLALAGLAAAQGQSAQLPKITETGEGYYDKLRVTKIINASM
jgi:hypothetical protein